MVSDAKGKSFKFFIFFFQKKCLIWIFIVIMVSVVYLYILTPSTFLEGSPGPTWYFLNHLIKATCQPYIVFKHEKNECWMLPDTKVWIAQSQWLKRISFMLLILNSIACVDMDQRYHIHFVRLLESHLSSHPSILG